MDRADGHDSIADARASLDLARLKFEGGPDFGAAAVALAPVTLLLAVQNKAIDVLVRGIEPFVDNDFRTSSVGMLVIGSAFNPNVGEAAATYTLDGLLFKNEEYKAALAEYERLIGRAGPSPAAQVKQEELRELRLRLTDDIISSARIMFSTTAELFSMFIHPTLKQCAARIKSVIIDEAGTIPEFEAAILAVLPAVERIICIGDIQQLPPFSHMQAHMKPEGFMERVQAELCAADGGAVRMLRRQFRMSRDICNFVSEAFYSGQLIMDDLEGAKRMPEFVPGRGIWLSGIYWLDYSEGAPTHALREVLLGDGRGSQIEIARIAGGFQPQHCMRGHCEEAMFNSKANATEIHHIICGLEMFCDRHLFTNGALSKQVAVICFYRLQCEVLEASIARSRVRRQLQAAKESGGIRIRTVDSFQGSEADIVILSGVRSNALGEVGFLASSDGNKRICVATSRAKEAFILVGDRATLASSRSRPLAFGRLWSESEPRPTFGVRKIESFADLAQPAAAREARRAEESLISDLFG